MTRKRRKKDTSHQEEVTRGRKKPTLAEKTLPYPEKLYVVNDPCRSDVFCMRNFSSAYVTVSGQPGEDTVNYVREDVVPKYAEVPLKESLSKAKEELLIWQDRVESLKAARVAVITTNIDRLKTLMTRSLVLFGATALVLFFAGYFFQKYLPYLIDIFVWFFVWCLSFQITMSTFTEEIKYWKEKVQNKE